MNTLLSKSLRLIEVISVKTGRCLMPKKEGRLTLKLVDVTGKRLRDKVTITLQHRSLSHKRTKRNADPADKIVIDGLHAVPKGWYRMVLEPKKYRPVSHYVNVKSNTRRTVVFSIDPDKAAPTFPRYNRLDRGLVDVLERSDKVRSYTGKTGQELYEALDDLQRAALLNLTAKSFVTPLPNGASMLPSITLRRLEQDRCFADVPKQLFDSVKGLVGSHFREAGSGLHKPPKGYRRAGSFKTEDRYGNLQFTFFRKDQDYVADIDIDDAGGMGHIFQVLEHHLKDSKTHPYDIHQILIRHQDLNPGYGLNPV